MLPYVCPYMKSTCLSTPCKGLIEGDASDTEKGCTFSNPKVLSACEHANKTEAFEKPCKEGLDYSREDKMVTYSDSTLIGDEGLTWEDIKEEAMAADYKTSPSWVSRVLWLKLTLFCLLG